MPAQLSKYHAALHYLICWKNATLVAKLEIAIVTAALP